MNLHGILARTQKMVADNSPAILTAIGVTGTITTAYLTGKATFMAAEMLADEQQARDIRDARTQPNNVMTPRDKAQMVWKLYIPAVTTGVLTCICIVGANRIGTRRAAAVATAYAISQEAFDEYKHKVVERIGDKKEMAIRDEIAQDRVTRNPPDDRIAGQIVTGDGMVLCHDAYSGRYFASNMEKLRKAENDITKQILADGSASLSNFYNNVGLPQTSISDDVGWNHEEPCVLGFSSVLTPDNRPCLSYDFQVSPIRDFWRFG